MNKWFKDIFLPSIFEGCIPGQNKWLSQKQTKASFNQERRRGSKKQKRENAEDKKQS